MKTEIIDKKALMIEDETINGSQFFDLLASTNNKYELIYFLKCNFNNIPDLNKPISDNMEFIDCSFDNTCKIRTTCYPNCSFVYGHFEQGVLIFE